MILPLPINFLFGQFIGILFYCKKRKRQIAYRNIKMAFPEKTSKEVKQILLRSYINFGISLIETLIAPRILKYIEFRGKDNIDADGGIVTGIHQGSWELYDFACAKNFKFAVLAKKQKPENLDKIFNEVRRESGLAVCFSLKEIVKYIKDAWSVGLVVDHGAEDNALFIKFFSHLVPTPSGIIHLARKFNKKIHPSFGYRKKGFYHVVEIGKPIAVGNKSDGELLLEINQFYENYLRVNPYEYLWHYKRFKHKKDISVLILSDGKLGHLKQSLAFLSILKEENIEIAYKIIKFKYRSKLARTLADIFAFFAPKSWLGYRHCFSFLINDDARKEIDATYADIVVSTASFAASLNKIVAVYLGAKSVSILRPNIPLNRFDLAIMPKHDRVYSSSSVIIKGALVYPQDLESKARQCQDKFKLTSNKKIALFIGGVLTDEEEFLVNLDTFLHNLKEFSLQNNYKILASASRRTPKKADELIAKHLDGFENTEAIVYPNQQNYDFVFEGFCFLSDFVFVSGESISMVSEVISAKKPCSCVNLENLDYKRKIFHESLDREVYFLNKPYTIDKIKLRVSDIFEENRQAVKSAIKKIL